MLDGLTKWLNIGRVTDTKRDEGMRSLEDHDHLR